MTECWTGVLPHSYATAYNRTYERTFRVHLARERSAPLCASGRPARHADRRSFSRRLDARDNAIHGTSVSSQKARARGAERSVEWKEPGRARGREKGNESVVG